MPGQGGIPFYLILEAAWVLLSVDGGWYLLDAVYYRRLAGQNEGLDRAALWLNRNALPNRIARILLCGLAGLCTWPFLLLWRVVLEPLVGRAGWRRRRRQRRP